MGARSQGNGRASEPTDPILQSGGSAPNLDGMLAGQVIDLTTGRSTSASIRWVCLDDGKGEQANIDVATDERGYFIIQGLKAGKRYKLIAQSKQGDRVLSGVTYKIAPNPACVIKLQEDRSAPASTQPAPPQPPPPAPPDKKAARAQPKGSSPEAVPVWEPGVGSVAVPPPNPSPPVGIRTPVPLAPAPPAPPAGPVDPSRIAEGQARTRVPPPANIGGPAPVPSCVLYGQQLRNFALNDLDGKAWEYRAQRRGKLMLIDFWATNCLHCLRAAPHVRGLRERFGPAGLEVVGIAYEGPGRPAEHAQRVRAAAQKHQMNCTLLLGSPRNCPVKTQFSVRVLPTLVLMDENGWMLWRHEGNLEPAQLQELERRIAIRLGVN
jgi:thiol-disulfide isomerase/thioredoxin